ncbi:MAG TPA: MotA/TolQ/ExbB proton channel family protein [Candidatus Tripitaka californicus]|uniref:MotA/TolQ/ExbB proton channel family protein n=1 Tax=Candidatus Tripitaka californicus TaxID=3367616 RepID=UPI0040258F98|nr:MotA/TolQ/ExbB proton channel family protein [Planctomycetota bacterium]
MELLQTLQRIFYFLSSLLLYPVLLLLLALLAYSIYRAGKLTGEFVSRRQEGYLERRHVEALIGWRGHTGETAPPPCIPQGAWKSTTRLWDIQNNSSVPLETALGVWLQETEQALTRPLERLRLAAKLGPSLGLMGTLIPMCNALAELSHGNLSRVADQLIIAFSTTVVGVAVACLCYPILVLKQKWVVQELRNLEYLVEVTVRENNSKQGESHEVSKKETSCQTF